MRIRNPLAVSAFLMLFHLAPAIAQLEISGGVGAQASRLGVNFKGGEQTPYQAKTFVDQTLTLSAGWRPNAHLALRSVAVISQRDIDLVVPTPQGRRISFSSNYADLSLEAAYYPRPNFSLGGGLGYALQLPGYLVYASEEAVLTKNVREQAGPDDFVFAHLALEGYTRWLTLRVAPFVGLGQGHRQDLAYTDMSGASLGPLRGRWIGVQISLLMRVPFGKTKHGTTVGIDSLLDRSTAGLQSRLPNWSFGLQATSEPGVRVAEGSAADPYAARPTRGELGLVGELANAADRWRFRSTVGLTRGRYTQQRDSVLRPNIGNTDYSFNGIRLAVGAARRVAKHLYVAAESGPLFVGNDWRRRSYTEYLVTPQTSPIAGPAPIARTMLLGTGMVYYELGDRFRLGAQATYTLSNPNGHAVDTRLTPATSRKDRWLGIGVNAQYVLLKASRA